MTFAYNNDFHCYRPIKIPCRAFVERKFELQQGVRFDPDMPQTIRLEFAKSNTKVSKPKQQPGSVGSGPGSLGGPGNNNANSAAAAAAAAAAASAHQSLMLPGREYQYRKEISQRT